jgi:hypothetical protein
MTSVRRGVYRGPWTRAVLAGLWLASSGCATAKLLRLENEVLKQRTEELETALSECQVDAPSKDFATRVTMEVLADFLVRSDYTNAEQTSERIFTIPIRGRNAEFQVSVQLFERENVLYFAIHDYLTLEEAVSSQSMVLLLTQLATMNYELLLGKFQLNPRSGEISLSVEVQVDDGLGFKTFDAVLNHIIFTADQRQPALLRAARGRSI